MPNQLSRRDWLRIMGIAAGTTALPLSSLARNEYCSIIININCINTCLFFYFFY